MFLEVKNITKKYGKTKVIKDLSLALDKHKTLSILGKSGCGKTTFLKIVAGLTSADTGDIYLNERNINDLKTSERNIVYLYQEDLLFPHLNAFENIAFGLRIKKVKEKEIQTRVMEMFEALELLGQEEKMPQQLSGGQRQRVSFGRAIITNPSLLLLDEPFGSLDAGTRTKMQKLFKDLSVEYSITSLFVTHDLKEAILMGDHIGSMQRGVLQVYNSKGEFIQDTKSGVREEIEFWQELTGLQKKKQKI